MKQKGINRRLYWIAIGTITAVTIMLADVFLVGNTQYVVTWLRCGEQPVVLYHPREIGFGYQNPSNIVRTNPSIFDSKDPIVDSLDASLHCRIQELQQEYGDTLQPPHR